MTHGITYHGGFHVGDIVELTKGSKNLWRIIGFVGTGVEVSCSKCGVKAKFTVFDIRHPNLVREK